MLEDPSFDRLTQTILNRIASLFAQPDFDNHEGELQLLDRDDRCVWLRLFPTEAEGEPSSETLTVTWTIEVSHDRT